MAKAELILGAAVALAGCAQEATSTEEPARSAHIIVDCQQGPFVENEAFILRSNGSVLFGGATSEGQTEVIEIRFAQNKVTFHPINTSIKFESNPLGGPIRSEGGIIYTVQPPTGSPENIVLDIKAECVTPDSPIEPPVV
jgi:hypothetical protein